VIGYSAHDKPAHTRAHMNRVTATECLSPPLSHYLFLLTLTWLFCLLPLLLRGDAGSSTTSLQFVHEGQVPIFVSRALACALATFGRCCNTICKLPQVIRFPLAFRRFI
jgi:hypothetical protein